MCQVSGIEDQGTRVRPDVDPFDCRVCHEGYRLFLVPVSAVSAVPTFVSSGTVVVAAAPLVVEAASAVVAAVPIVVVTEVPAAAVVVDSRVVPSSATASQQPLVGRVVEIVGEQVVEG